MSVRTRLLEDHKADCFAVEAVEEGTWPTPWAYLERVQRRDKLGRTSRPGSTGDRWWYVRCNDPSCPGRITVNETDLLAGVS